MTSSGQVRRAKRNFATSFYQLGCVDFGDAQHVQQRLAYDALSRGDGRMAFLLCEHEQVISLGRGAVRGDVRFSATELENRGISLRYIPRGGGAVWHQRGQLAIYPIVPLRWHRLSVGQFVTQFRHGVVRALAEQGYPARLHPASQHVLGTKGLIAAMGLAVKRGITQQGMFLNVSCDLAAADRVVSHTTTSLQTADRAAVRRGESMNCRLSDHVQAATIQDTSRLLVNHLAEVFGCESFHLQQSHPFLAQLPDTSRELAA